MIQLSSVISNVTSESVKEEYNRLYRNSDSWESEEVSCYGIANKCSWNNGHERIRFYVTNIFLTSMHSSKCTVKSNLYTSVDIVEFACLECIVLNLVCSHTVMLSYVLGICYLKKTVTYKNVLSLRKWNKPCRWRHNHICFGKYFLVKLQLTVPVFTKRVTTN